MDQQMDLKHWLTKANIGQRELARRLGYKGNGFVTLVANGKRPLPIDEAPRWAEKLALSADETLVFIEECKRDSIPDWVLSDLRQLRASNHMLVDLVAHRSDNPPPLPRDRAMTADQRLAELTNLRKINRALLDRLEISEGRTKRKKLVGVDHIPEPGG